ncbi:hypothetical protein [Corynebacterium pacaense]|uniref:hypothetical protein n=1 Tax=Corynebacterium pacaense TaxID=1816684 RepID=UPI0009B966E1|nr:hypothetical protein [Corynebacterium pacaense]
MEAEPVKSLKSVARRGAIMTVAAVSALALASCSAGQITQTSSQVAAVDGASVNSENGAIAVRDVTVHVTEGGEAGLKFTAINQDPEKATHTLEKISVDGTEVEFTGAEPLKANCSIVADIEEELDKLVEPDAGCIQHVATTLDNPGFAYGGVVPVEFTFDTGVVNVDATVAAPVHDAGTNDRNVGGHAEHSGH